MNEVDEFLANLSKGSSLENLENLENAEMMIRNGGSIKEAVRFLKNKGGVNHKIGMHTRKGIAVMFDIIVSRNQTTITADLPFVIFGHLETLNAYKNIINPILPSGVTLTSVVVTNGNYVFTYSDGTHTDVVTVKASQNTYAIIVQSLLLNKISIRSLKVSVSADDYIAQFDNPIFWKVRTPFGKTKAEDSITPSSLIDPDQNQKRFVDIGKSTDVNAHFLTVDSQTSVFCSIKQGVPSYTISLFVDDFDNLGGVH